MRSTDGRIRAEQHKQHKMTSPDSLEKPHKFGAQRGASCSNVQELQSPSFIGIFGALFPPGGNDFSDELFYRNFRTEPEDRNSHQVLAFESGECVTKYCSSCRKYLKYSAFSPKTRETCSVCLSRKKQKRQRGRCTSLDHERNMCSQNETKRLCSSCKCTKALTDFLVNGKTCFKCKQRKRRTRTVLKLRVRNE